MRSSSSFAALLLTTLAADAAWSDELPASCLTTAEATIHVTFQSNDTDPIALKHQFDTDLKAIESLAFSAHATRMRPGGMTYSIQPSYSGTVEPYDGPVNQLSDMKSVARQSQYQFQGMVNFDMAPASQGPEVLKLLLQKDWKATLDFVEFNQARRLCTLNAETGSWQ